MGAKSKYEVNIQPRLAEIEAWCRNGVKEIDIAANCGVAESTFQRYKIDHPELGELLRQTRAYVTDVVVEGAMLKRCKGYDAVEIKREYGFDQDGNRILVKETEQQKHIPPDSNMIEFFLCNRAPDRWQRTQNVKASLDVTGKDIALLDLKSLSDAELERLAAGIEDDGR